MNKVNLMRSWCFSRQPLFFARDAWCLFHYQHTTSFTNVLWLTARGEVVQWARERVSAMSTTNPFSSGWQQAVNSETVLCDNAEELRHIHSAQLYRARHVFGGLHVWQSSLNWANVIQDLWFLPKPCPRPSNTHKGQRLIWFGVKRIE